MTRALASRSWPQCRLPGFARRARGEEGTASLEFAIIFPIFLVLFLSTFEIGLLMVRQVMLDRATDIAVRTLRLGQWTDPTHDGLKDFICDAAAILPDCRDKLLIELNSVPKGQWSTLSTAASCLDKSEEMDPVIAPGQQHEFMVVRVCALQKPVFFLTAPGLNLTLHDDQHYAIVSVSGFVNEPS